MKERKREREFVRRAYTPKGNTREDQCIGNLPLDVGKSVLRWTTDLRELRYHEETMDPFGAFASSLFSFPCFP